MSYSACSVSGCDKKSHARGLCPMHYQRLRTRGAVGSGQSERTPHTGAVCAVDGCGQPRRKRDWCASHYSQWKRSGRVAPFTYKWSALAPCVVCGAPAGGGLRRFCGTTCHALFTAHSGAVPHAVTCVQCSGAIALTREEGRRRKRSDVRLCRRCRQDLRKHALSVEQLARRDGTDCGICGTAVDMTLRNPDPMRASVDHIFPKALGGPNVASNLQLAHLRCNSGKQHRLQQEAVV